MCKAVAFFLVLFQADDGIRYAHYCLEFRRVLFRSRRCARPTSTRFSPASKRKPAIWISRRKVASSCRAPSATPTASSRFTGSAAMAISTSRRPMAKRAGERRVGKGGVSKGKDRWSPYDSKNKTNTENAQKEKN